MISCWSLTTIKQHEYSHECYSLSYYLQPLLTTVLLSTTYHKHHESSMETATGSHPAAQSALRLDAKALHVHLTGPAAHGADGMTCMGYGHVNGHYPTVVILPRMS